AAAALLLAGDSRWGLVGAALSLQVKTVLDNVDGGLARATGRVTELGRYLDTGLDLIVNVLLFVALARHGPWPLAALALVVLTVVLSYDFNAEALYREARAGEPPAGDALAATAAAGRSEERRVGKECRSRGCGKHKKRNRERRNEERTH